MAALIRVDRCTTCRDRKVKCDENWPACGPCRKTNRTCPGPQSRVKFINHSTEPEATSTYDSLVDIKKFSPQSGKAMVLLHSKTAQTGTFHKLRIVSLPNIKKSPPLSTTCHSLPAPFQIPTHPRSSPEDQLLQRLVRAISIEEHKFSLLPLGHYWHWIPERIGVSKALDDAISAVVSAHNNALHGVPLTKAVDYAMYGRALRSLGAAVQDSAESRSSNTLTAATLLQALEFRFKPTDKANYVIHGSGLAELLRRYGPPSPGNKLDFYIALNAHGPLITSCLLGNDDIFLDQDEWTSALLDRNGRSDLQMLHYRLMKLNLSWPCLRRRLVSPHFSKFDCAALLQEIDNISKEVDKIGSAVQKLIDDKNLVSTRPSQFCENHVSESYHFLDPLVCQVITYHAQAAVAFKSMLRYLTTDSEGQEDLRYEILGYSRRIWMMYDYAKLNKPFAASWVSLALTLTIDLADRDMQHWITNAANDINAAEEDDNHYMDLPAQIYLAQAAYGKVPLPNDQL